MSTSTSNTDARRVTDVSSCRRALAVCARPDDLGLLVPQIRALVAAAVPVRLLCLSDGIDGDDHRRFTRARALARTAAVLGIEEIVLLDHGHGLEALPAEILVNDVEAAAFNADTVLAVSGDESSDPDRLATVTAIRRAADRHGHTVWFLPEHLE